MPGTISFSIVVLSALVVSAAFCAQAEISPDGHYLVIRDCFHPCFVTFRSSRVSGGNYTARLTSFQEYLSHEDDLWSMSSYFGSVGRVQSFDVPGGALPVQVPSGKLAAVFTCPGNETCLLQYQIESGQSWLDSVRRDDLSFYTFASFLLLAGILLCGVFVFAGCSLAWVASALKGKKPEDREMKEYITIV